jgi:hypothetical protein
MGPIYLSASARARLPKTHYTDDPRGYQGRPICGATSKYRELYVTGLGYRVDCQRCNNILDNRDNQQEG